MNPKDYEDYKKNNVKASKSQLKEYIQIYSDMVKKLKSEDAIELTSVKNNIKKTYPKEIYFTLVDEEDDYVRFTISETSEEYFIVIFSDIEKYDSESGKISELFSEKLQRKVITPEDISSLAGEDENFKGFKINPLSQNFNMDRNGSF